MLQSPKSKSETENATETLDKVLLDAIRGIVYEPHEEHVDYEEEMRYEETDRQQSSDSGGGGSALPMLLVGVAFGAIGYMMGKRSRSSGQMGGGTSEKIRSATDDAAERTEEMAESTADRIRETGQELSERTDETAGQAADRIEESSEEMGDQIEEKGSEAADEMEDSD